MNAYSASGQGVGIMSAIISADGLYRYSLLREFPPLDPGNDRGRVCFQLCNPSTADATLDDATVRKGRGFALRWGYSSMEFVNRGAFRATNPKALLATADPIGPYNPEHVHAAFERADLIVFAWGKAWPTKLDHLSPPLPVPAMCLGRNGDGSPRHPLMLAYSTPLEPWNAYSASGSCVSGDGGIGTGWDDVGCAPGGDVQPPPDPGTTRKNPSRQNDRKDSLT